MIAALYVETDGVYYGLDDVDPWDEERDARLYGGPYSVVAHPPCARWCRLAPLVQSMHGYQIGDDDGCFEAALAAVRKWGGVLEHPAYSFAWPAFDLPRPRRGVWMRSIEGGWVTELSQAAYGHPARKRTWLYYVGDDPLPVDWSEPPAARFVSDFGPGGSRLRGEEWIPGVQYAEASRTPLGFRDLLIDLARSAQTSGVAA